MGEASQNDRLGHCISTTLTQCLAMFIGVITAIFLARLLGVANKGVFTFLGVIIVIITELCQIGCGDATTYYISSKKYRSENVLVSAIANSVVQGLVVVAVIILFYSSGQRGQPFIEIETSLAVLILTAIPFEFAFSVVRKHLVGISNFGFLNLIAIISRIAFLVVFLGFWKYGLKPLESACYSLVFQKLIIQNIVVMVALFYIRPQWNIDFKYIRELYKYGGKMWLGSIANNANAKLDSLIIGLFLPFEALGLYSVGYSVFAYLESLLTGISQVFFNAVAGLSSTYEREKLLLRSSRIMFGMVVISVGGLALIGQPLVDLIFGVEYSGAYLIMMIISIGMIPHLGTRRLGQRFLAAIGRPMHASSLEAVTALLSLAFYAVLTPYFGVIGVAIATSLAYFLGSIYAIYIVRRVCSVRLREFFLPQYTDWLFVRGVMRKLLRGM
jgi:O-antigen/teichoic acid export membrane protein